MGRSVLRHHRFSVSKLWTAKFGMESCLFVGGLLILLANSIKAYYDTNFSPWVFGLGSASGLLILVAAGFKLYLAGTDAVTGSQEHSLTWVYPVLEMLHQALMIDPCGEFGEGLQDPNLRVCMHVSGNDEYLTQYSEYITATGQTNGKINRKMSRRCGIVGLALSSPDPGAVVVSTRPGDRTREVIRFASSNSTPRRSKTCPQTRIPSRQCWLANRLARTLSCLRTHGRSIFLAKRGHIGTRFCVRLE